MHFGAIPPDAAQSERELKRIVYQAIGEVAAPGDLIFTVTLGHPLQFHQKVWRSWLGHADGDSAKWHTALFSGMRKEHGGATRRAYMIHSAEQGLKHVGTIEEHISPGYYTSRESFTTSLEVLSFRGLDPSRRSRIVDHARKLLGVPHDPRGWRRDFLTYTFGLPVVTLPHTVSCHALAYQAYEAAGITFAHQVATMPWFNVARWRGRPFGQPAGALDVDSVYLRDHHLYEDARFDVVLSISRHDGRLSILRNPGKYVWLPTSPVREVTTRQGVPLGVRGRTASFASAAVTKMTRHV